MKTVLMTVPAHFDGTQIRLDVGVELKPDTRLLVTILGEEPSNLEPHPEEPPRTPEGNQIALAAVERMAGMIPISDPELARWLAESPELSIYGGP